MDSGGFSVAWCWVVLLVVVLLPPPALLAITAAAGVATKADERSVSKDKLTRRSAIDDSGDRATIVVDVERQGMGLCGINGMQCRFASCFFFSMMVVHQTPSLLREPRVLESTSESAANERAGLGFKRSTTSCGPMMC
jgi:hypothetical protein